jgi:hypothetical protein
VPRGTTFVSTLTVSVLIPALSGGTRPARVRPSPSRVRVGFQPFRPTLSMRPMEGYSSRSSPCAGVYQTDESATALDHDPKRAVRLALDLRPAVLDLLDGGDQVEIGLVRGSVHELTSGTE